MMLLALLPLLPVLVAPLLLLPSTAMAACRIAPWLPLAMLPLLSLLGTAVDLPWLLMGARVGLDSTALPLFVLAVVVWTIAGWHARRHLDPAGQPRFFFFWLLTWVGNSCVYLTLDAASFYAAYAMMTFSAYGLITHSGQAAAMRAARVYLVMALLGEGLLIAGLVGLGASVGNIDLRHGPELVGAVPGSTWISLCLMGGFAVKMGLVPLHMWLPLAHPEAPVPASAVLSGVIITAGLMGWLRFLPLGHPGFEGIGGALLVLALITIFAANVFGVAQERAKTVLAYSSISQMGLIAVVLALALRHPEQSAPLLTVAGLFALHHGLAKAALFLGMDLVHGAPQLARRLLWIPAITIAGAPLTSGALAKVIFKTHLPETVPWLGPILFASSVLTTLLMLRFLAIALPRADARAEAGGSSLPWLALVAVSLTLPWFAYHASDPLWPSLPFKFTYLLGTALPVLTGLVLGLAAGYMLRGRRWLRIPEGDLIVLLRRPHLKPLHLSLRLPRPAPERISALLDTADAALARPSLVWVCWLLLLAGLFFIAQRWPGT